jgi:hypothetical protein
MESKIDIIKFINQLNVEDYSNGETRNNLISELKDNELSSYNDFNQLVQDKLGNNEQIFVSNSQVVRFAIIYDFEVDKKGFQEVLYDDLSDSEKLIFDNFYNTFTSWQQQQ